MRNDIVVTTVGQQYAAAHAAHYDSKDLREALTRYKALLAAHPDTREAGYARSQIQNIVKVVVSDQTLSDAHLDLATAHFEGRDRPDTGPVPVASFAEGGDPPPSGPRSARKAAPFRVLALVLGLFLCPAVASAQADLTETPANAHAKRYRDGWECDWGYRAAGPSCEPIIVPAHAHLDAFGGRWECDRGYRPLDQVCVPVKVPPNAFLNSSGRGWQCDRGYLRNEQACETVVVPANAYLTVSGDRWKCERGFQKSGTSCVVFVIPRNAHIDYSGNTWTCNPGYRQRGDACRPDEQ